MKRKYRIVKDNFCGYEAQQWRWYWPFWTQLGFVNTHTSIEDARAYIDGYSLIVVEYYTPKQQEQ